MLKARACNTNLIATLVVSTLLLTGCGGGESSTNSVASEPVNPVSGSVPAPTTTTTASGLSISGAPATTATVGVAYAFSPTAGGGSGYAYSIANKPAWTTFDASTGSLTGTPSASDVGDYGSIVISVTSGNQTASLTPFRINVAAPTTAGAATLSWTPPTTNTDGTSLTNLAGYNIYYGADPSSLTNKIQVSNAGLTSYTVTGLGPGTHYFTISAYSVNGVESDPSGVGSLTIS